MGYTSDGAHVWRWRYPNGRVSWTYSTRDFAERSANPLWSGDMRLQFSPDNGQTWRDAQPTGQEPQ